MQTSRRELFTTIRSEGAILPVDLLQRVAAGDDHLAGLKPADYHLCGERLNEAINRSWNRLLGDWASFQAARKRLADTEPGTGLTRDRWLMRLFVELEYGRLQPARAVDIEGRDYPISHWWNDVPIHLLGCNVPLDRRTPGVPGAARMSPHSMLQELLNRTDYTLWGFLSNGLQLRILRDNASLTRQAYVEFDLEAMMNGEIYADFVLLWLLCHQSRVEAERPADFWLEHWSKEAWDQGTRALDGLRGGVKDSITHLGKGFLAHPANRELRDKLYRGELDRQDYYRQLLRTVYRLLFLFVAEDRDLLVKPGTPDDVRQRYDRFYSTRRLRTLAERRRGTRHIDLWRGLSLLFRGLGQEDGVPQLGLPALGSFLWGPDSTPDLEGCEITNADLLTVIRDLAFIQDGKVRRAVDYRNLGSEELGSVYESLLELQPVLNLDSREFHLEAVAGNERKTTASFYTPSSLINSLLDTALDPVLDEASRSADPESAILDLKVCDPASGSGHFLIAAAHRIARRLASVRTDEEEPSVEATRAALRDVISRCIYGVDINPMAVELCKFSLWMEALEPGKPLSFLDHRIQTGNSLLGTTPALMAGGIPDDAFKPIEGDDKKYVAEWRKNNQKYKKGLQSSFGDELLSAPWERLGNLPEALQALNSMSDDTLNDQRQKEQRWQELVSSATYENARLLADAWCSAFTWNKTSDYAYPITENVFRDIERSPHRIPPWMNSEIQRLAAQYQFFHWHLAFPDVFRAPGPGEEPENELTGWSGGFDVVLGNPPWDTLSPDRKEFFTVYNPHVRHTDSMGQDEIIEELLKDPLIKEKWNRNCRELYSQVHFFKTSGYYRLFAPGNLGKGDFNVYRMFIELTLRLTGVGRRFGQIVPEGFYNGANAMAIRKALFDTTSISHIFGFENARRYWFRDADTRLKFCLYSTQKKGHTTDIRVAFNIRNDSELTSVSGGQYLTMPTELIHEFSPEALAIMEFSSQAEVNTIQKPYSIWPKLGDVNSGEPYRQYMRELDMGNDRHLFSEDLHGIPVYEGRMIDQFDHRAKGYRSGRGRSAVWEELPFGSENKSIQPQWRIPWDQVPNKTRERIQTYRVGFADVASPTNERSFVAALIPPNCLCGHKVPTLTYPSEYEWAYLIWLAVANSFPMDFLVRKKVSLGMSFTLVDSLPFPRLSVDHPTVARIAPLVLRLTCTSPEMSSFWNRMAQYGWVKALSTNQMPPGLDSNEQRSNAQAELDAIVALELFDLNREELSQVLDAFPIVMRRDMKKHGEYRTKRVILEIYDAMHQAIDTGTPYQTRLDPPPADPSVGHV